MTHPVNSTTSDDYPFLNDDPLREFDDTQRLPVFTQEAASRRDACRPSTRLPSTTSPHRPPSHFSSGRTPLLESNGAPPPEEDEDGDAPSPVWINEFSPPNSRVFLHNSKKSRSPSLSSKSTGGSSVDKRSPGQDSAKGRRAGRIQRQKVASDKRSAIVLYRPRRLSIGHPRSP